MLYIWKDSNKFDLNQATRVSHSMIFLSFRVSCKLTKVSSYCSEQKLLLYPKTIKIDYHYLLPWSILYYLSRQGLNLLQGLAKFCSFEVGGLGLQPGNRLINILKNCQK